MINVENEIKRQRIQGLIYALQQFNYGYRNLLEEWSLSDIMDETENIDLYPFQRSFDELEIPEWVVKTITELNELYKGLG